MPTHWVGQSFSHSSVFSRGNEDRQWDDLLSPVLYIPLCQHSWHPQKEKDGAFLSTTWALGAQNRSSLPVTQLANGAYCDLQARVLLRAMAWGSPCSPQPFHTLLCTSLFLCMPPSPLHFIACSQCCEPGTPTLYIFLSIPAIFQSFFSIPHHCPPFPAL